MSAQAFTERLRATDARPTRPEPSSHTAPGTGTAETDGTVMVRAGETSVLSSTVDRVIKKDHKCFDNGIVAE